MSVDIAGFIEHHSPEDRIQNGRGVSDVKIERDEFAAEVQLRVIVERRAAIYF